MVGKVKVFRSGGYDPEVGLASAKGDAEQEPMAETMAEKQKLTRAELNQLAAEKVMGWVWVTHKQLEPIVGFAVRWLHPGVMKHWIRITPASGFEDISNTPPFEIPDYASDPAASKRLRGKMRADGWRYDISSPSSRIAVFMVSMVNIRNSGLVSSRREGSWEVGSGATEELAVLISALRAVGAISGEVEVTE